ncbi:MAG: hypothetical protein JWM16_3277, partial [Verrucomicrobiales bacterium]|nr:hypothetical protein [Verrucomicrobiales bacterium]
MLDDFLEAKPQEKAEWTEALLLHIGLL